MIKSSLLLMVLLTVLVSYGLRWRETRMAALRPAVRAPRLGPIARGKLSLHRWITAAAIAAIASLLLLGGMQWFRIWQGG